MNGNFYRYFVYLVLLAGIAFRLYGAFYAKRGLSHDESVTYQCAAAKEGDYCIEVDSFSDKLIESKTITRYYDAPADHELSKIAADLALFDIHPPLYFWLLHLIYKIMGLQLFTGLIINITCTLLMCFLLYRISLQLFNRTDVALTAVALWLLSPAVLQIDLESRHYQLFGLLSLLHVYLSYQFFILERQKNSIYGSFIGCNVLGLLTHYYYPFILLPSFLLALLKFRLTRKFWLYTATLLVSIVVFYLIFPQVSAFLSKYLEQPKESSLAFNFTKVKVFIYCTAQFFTQLHYLRYLFILLFSSASLIFLFRHRSFIKSWIIEPGKARFFFLYFTWFAAFSFLFYVFGISPGHAVGEQYFSYFWPLLSIFTIGVLRKLFPAKANAIYLLLLLHLLPSAFISIQKSQYVRNIIQEGHEQAITNADLVYFNDNMRGHLPRFCLNLKADQRIIVGKNNEGNLEILKSFSTLALVEFYEGRAGLNVLADSLQKAGYQLHTEAADNYKLYYLKK